MFQVFHQTGAVLYYNCDFSNVQGTPIANSELKESKKWENRGFVLGQRDYLYPAESPGRSGWCSTSTSIIGTRFIFFTS